MTQGWVEKTFSSRKDLRKRLTRMTDWRKPLFIGACAGIIVLSVAIIYASYVEVVLKESFYSMVIKIFSMIVAVLGLIIGLLRIPKENIP